MAKCKLCGGTGKLCLMKSVYIYDRLHHGRCRICGGTGVSSHICAADWNSDQANKRATFPVHPQYAARTTTKGNPNDPA